MVAKVKKVAQPRYSEFKVGNAITIMFLRSLPGSESTIATELCALPGATVYKVFGEADFAIVREFSDQPTPPQLSENGGISHLRNIISFNWEGLNALPTSKIGQYPLIGFCFLKANPDFLRDQGIQGEYDLLRAIKGFIRRNNTGVRAAVCGTVGWFEAILLVCGTTVGDILRFTNALRRLSLVWNDKRTTHKIPCFQTTETIPAILVDHGFVRPGVELGRGVEVELRASCYSWADSRVKEYLKKLGSPRPIAGTDDFVVRKVHTESLSEYVKVLWDIRSHTKNLLYSTRTNFILQRSEGGLEEGLEIRPIPKISANMEHPRLQQLSKENPTLYQMLRDTHLLLNDILSDYRKNWAVNDLTPFAEELFSSYLNSEHRLKAYRADENQVLGESLEMLRWGLQQRFFSTEAIPAGIPPVPSNAGGAGGIHRILTALSFIPEVLIEDLGRKWTGFITYGWTDDYKRFSGGVLNIRSEAIFQPHTWFVLFHEIGHEYASQIDIINNANIRRALIKEGMYTRESLEEVYEVYAEIFACLFGFGGDFNKCIGQTWRYLQSLDKVQANLSQFFLRFLMTYIFMLEDSGSKYINSKVELLDIARKLKRSLGKYTDIISDIDEEEISFMCSKALKLRNVLNVIRDLMPTKRIPWLLKKTNSTPLREGRILFTIDNPVQFLSSIPSLCPSPTFRQSVAITLSLWNARMMYRPRG